ncbi:unnamed protein product [Vicia faba]|uniref:Exonuclease domain-containing protein n=1 Tax=Vicia faba TaxID=3906 RepID=A0AAV0YIW5_VICFA|nr:unnamed protein product [Vicia faba]CAI8584042.1 unnamed protein product [Vicia faba]CAI8589991.1 unnamed protein product [Vicia faba]
MLTGLMDNHWKACTDWVNPNGKPNLQFFSTHFGSSKVQVDKLLLLITLKLCKIEIPLTRLHHNCEMVLCEDGTEALVEVCIVDHNLEVKLHELVKPEKAIKDYRTEITGVSSKDLETVTRSLADIQKLMKKWLSSGAILVGHSLYNDLRVLKLYYDRVVDTAYIFQPMDGATHRRPSLNSLCQASNNLFKCNARTMILY